MQVIGNEMPDQMKEVVARLYILLSAILAKLAKHFATAVKAVRFNSVILMTHQQGLASQR